MELDAIFRPRSVAIIGASRTPGKVGHVLISNMQKCGFKGKIYPINPNAEEILGLRCYHSILDVPGNVDLAVIAIPAASVLNVAEECGVKGIRALIVISAGFKETGPIGAKLEKQLIEIGTKYCMRIQGPNCLGVINTSTPLNLSFASEMPKEGRIGFISQSGALGTAVLDWVINEGIGFSSFVSLGNKADLDEVDFVKMMGEDDKVDVILLYIESIEDGKRFLDISRKVIRKKPIIVLKGGVSTAGAHAAGSHTGALVGSFVAYETAFNKVGVILVESVESLFNQAIAFTEQPLPKGGGVAIITNAGGPGILATDLCERLGLKLARLSFQTQRRLIERLPTAASTGNPIDILGDAKSDRYGFSIEASIMDEGVSSLIILLTPQAMTESMKTAEEIVEIHGRFRDKPILTVFMGGASVKEASDYLKKNHIPCFNFPEKAVKTLSALFEYARFLNKPRKPPVTFYDVDKNEIKKIFDVVRQDGRVVLLPQEASEVVGAYGIRTPKSKVAKTAEEAVMYAEELGYPVVLKIISPDILHKTDIGGVVLNLRSADEVYAAFNGIRSRVERFMARARIYGIMVSEMIPMGKEMIIGMNRDVQFGPLVMVGLGGIYVNFLKDVSFGLPPLSEIEARLMIEKTKAYSLLKGIRGESPSDVAALEETILRVGQLVCDFPQIVEMDINPVMVYGRGEGCIALDVKITLIKD